MSGAVRHLPSRFTGVKPKVVDRKDCIAIKQQLANRGSYINIGTVVSAALKSGICSYNHWNHEVLTEQLLTRGFEHKFGWHSNVLHRGNGLLNAANKTFLPARLAMRGLTSDEIDEVIETLCLLNHEKIMEERLRDAKNQEAGSQ